MDSTHSSGRVPDWATGDLPPVPPGTQGKLLPRLGLLALACKVIGLDSVPCSTSANLIPIPN